MYPLPPLPNRFPAARLSPKIIGPWYNWPPENCLLENFPLVRLPSGEFPTSIITPWRITPKKIVLETPPPGWGFPRQFAAVLLNLENPLKKNNRYWMILQIIQICEIYLLYLRTFILWWDFYQRELEKCQRWN